MGMSCTICNHSERLQIDRQIVQGISHTKIAKEHGLSNQAVRYHAQNHLSRQLLKHNEIRERISSERVLDEIEDILSRAKRILRDSEADGQRGMALNAIREIRCTIEFLSKLAITLHEIQKEEEAADQEDQEDGMQQRMYEQGLKILTYNELSFLDEIAKKMAALDADMIIIPDDPKKAQQLLNDPSTIGPVKRAVEVKSAIDGAVLPSTIEEDLPNREQQSIEQVIQEPEQPEPTTMKRRRPIGKIYYGSSLPFHKRRRIAKQYVRDHGCWPKEEWLRETL